MDSTPAEAVAETHRPMPPMPDISVIVPTRNRSASLREALKSLLHQSMRPQGYEIIVVDNGSTDDTRSLAEDLARCLPGRLRYVYQGSPGLHQARHTGAKIARSEILSFVDDDILAHPVWLETVRSAFVDKEVALVGGRILPQWEAPIPSWVRFFNLAIDNGVVNGFLSLSDFGPQKRIVPPEYVFGCNFSVSKDVLYQCGGFHPDSMPQDLIHMRGDGETALSLAIAGKGHHALYDPEACIYHRVPPQRLTVEYFCQRAFNQGVSDSYTEIRAIGRVPDSKIPDSHYRRAGHPVAHRVADAYQEGIAFHRRKVDSDPSLLDYIFRKDYL